MKGGGWERENKSCVGCLVKKNDACTILIGVKKKTIAAGVYSSKV